MPNLLSNLIGRRCNRLFADSETKEWIFDFGEGLVLQANCPWRIVVAGRNRLGWRDDGQKFGLPGPLSAAARAAELLATPVDSAQISNEAGDLTVTFGVGCQLELFNDSAGYEGWTLNGPRGAFLVAQGGGQTVEGRRPDV